MRVLVVGSGGREHALCERLAASPRVSKLFAIPGNAGIGKVAECVDVRSDRVRAVVSFARDQKIDLVVVGPEAPLVDGLADELERLKIPVFGPHAAGAQLEGSKAFAKQLMRQNNIPTAAFQVFKHVQDARDYLSHVDLPIVVKCDGLAAGKGVRVCRDRMSALAAVEDFMVHRCFGEAGDTIVVEECLEGDELSLLVVSDGRTMLVLESARDHKRLLDGDEGPNTGGMGAFSPSAAVNGKLLGQVEHRVLLPLLHALNGQGVPYRGVIYAGLMLTVAGPKVLEFNVRFGDPEAQAVLPRLKSDLADLLLLTATGRLDKYRVKWDRRPSLCVVLASRGYPAKPETGHVIEGLDDVAAMDDVHCYHSGTSRRLSGDICTSGGRVLGITALGEDLAAARLRAYEAIERIKFDGMQYRLDIGLPPSAAGQKG